ncbi:HpcH/HpaI aldolase/citrate lyase family protein [Glaciimonas immobilis]|uniref:Citrate lyase subunit beta/citryl-CoA lyase n=1 Tax=Glaciimonas immobilis TaxID=728004 RepID=A0A840RL80_9BURK|nr:CoA ester lyase [Glaciimonas immobilis]KAF3999496.1 CoA ester lyase [Glaciimonas immobilis]MBB5199017.1 citrate lyase subunit beta/citryl-CoA lyase [Glaciimonas immobilis]
MHPTEVLFLGKQQPVSLPACDHYAGAEKIMRKSVTLQHTLGPVFDITFDCEDGAASGNEVAHARLVAEVIASPDNRFNRIGARVHDVGSSFFEQDVEIICHTAATRLAYLMLPKVERVADVIAALDLINHHSQRAGRTTMPVHVLIETHGALADVTAIAALPQIESLSFGIMDFVSAHYGAIPSDAMRSPGQFVHPLVTRAKLEIAAACHAHGKTPSHNVTTDIKNNAVVADDARRARMEFGYTRMWSIHPQQVQQILNAFLPSQSEVSEAAEILLAAQKAAWGPIQHRGTLHDRASYRYYWTVLQRAKNSGITLPPLANALFLH